MNKKFLLSACAILGITGGLLVAAKNPSNGEQPNNPDEKHQKASSNDESKSKDQQEEEKRAQLMAQNITYHDMTEEELLSQLNEEATALYKSLDEEGKRIARNIASNKCNGTNECKGQNACETEKNPCAGKGNCKGQSKCAVSDANLAVKLAAKVMAEKRANATKR